MKSHDRSPSAGCEARSPLTTRRRFLAVVSTGTASALAAAGCSGSNPCGPESFGDVTLGQPATISVGTLQAVPGAPALIGRDDAGIYAMTITCTHQCCNVSATGTGSGITVVCPCHGSRFDRNGSVIQGPAASPLVHYQVDMSQDGLMVVRGGIEVPASTRLTVA
jgi:nitrite reductase/ring-hydroxylating ferredoxin subunit